MITLKFTSTSAKAIDRLKAQAPKAITRALNKSIASAKTAMGRVIAQDMGIKVGDVAKKLVVKQARPGRQVATLYADATRLPLSAFNAKQTRAGVTYRIGKAGRKQLPHAFLARVRGPLPTGVVSPGHNGVFVRRGKARLPIDQRFGPSIWAVFKHNEAIGLARGQEQLEKNLKSEFRFALELESGA